MHHSSAESCSCRADAGVLRAACAVTVTFRCMSHVYAGLALAGTQHAQSLECSPLGIMALM